MLLKASSWADLIAVFRPSATPGSWRAETKKDVLAAEVPSGLRTTSHPRYPPRSKTGIIGMRESENRP
jgi:hypothetical protein